MKFTVTMKHPDCLYEAVQEAVERDLDKAGLSGEEREALLDSRALKIRGLCAAWFEYGEYLSVEVDTESKTCVVLPVK